MTAATRHLLIALAAWAAMTGFGWAQSGRAEGPYAVPTVEQAFIEGRFMIKRSALRRLDEDHYGEELDLSVRRPAVDLGRTVFETRYGRAGTRLYGNFRHRDRFWIVRVPDRGVRNTYFQLVYFPPKVLNRYIAAHSLLRMEMEAPVELVAPMPDAATLQALRTAPIAQRAAMLPDPLPPTGDNLVRDVVISAEAQWTKNDKQKRYDLKRGMLGAYVQVVLFASMETRWEGFFKTGNPSTQIKLDLARPEMGDAVLREALRTSQADGLGKLYDTLWYNCTTLAFDIVERGTELKDRRVDLIRAFMQRRVPVVAPEKLQQYGGLEARPIGDDPSLLPSAAAALARRSPGGPLCPAGMEAANCENIQQVVGRLPSATRSAAL